MKLQFPDKFLWGTSTSALQIETAGPHDWKGIKARDGSRLERTIDHELHRNEDAKIISSIGNAYRFSPDWSKLQKGPNGYFDSKVIDEYRNFMGTLKGKGMHLMLVLHHFANPKWFPGWHSKDAVPLFTDYAAKMALVFWDLVDSFNTINEPGVYASHAYLIGEFPPHESNPYFAFKALKNMEAAHNIAYDRIKSKLPGAMVGVSNNTLLYSAENMLGKVTAKIADKILLEYIPDLFSSSDFIGMSYYGRVPFTPFPATEFNNPGKLAKLGKEHDKMWEYYPEGLTENLVRFHKRYKKPIIITENGCCTDDDNQRIRSIKGHLKAAHDAIKQGVDLRGYFHWSTFDNFELYLGKSFRFGLVDVNQKTMERTPKESAKVYAEIAKNNCLEI
jgi:beta-glucosidase